MIIREVVISGHKMISFGEKHTEGCEVPVIFWFGFGQWDRSVILFGIGTYIK